MKEARLQEEDSNVATVSPGQTVTVRLEYEISDCGCPTCIDEIEIGYAGRDTYEYCAYQGVPGCRNSAESGEHEHTLQAPTTPGVYELRFGRRQDYNCNSRTWWQGTPPHTRAFATICVQAP